LFIQAVRGKVRTEPPTDPDLNDVTLRLQAGEFVALIGANGSGKSTLLRLLAGIYPPTRGSVRVQGNISAIIELGAGFHPQLTGRENVALYASIFGLGRKDLATRWDWIVEFSELGTHLDTPIKYLSTGMVARLAFSVALSVNPDIMLLDEVLAVGDAAFRIRCLRKMEDFRANGGTIMLVSHELEQVIELCSRAIWLHEGAVVADGDVEPVVGEYLRNQQSKA
jgi:ABC-2 type transport system ATP-binding protein